MFHPDAVDKNGDQVPQGYAQISIEILPKNLADEVPNGNGRDGPNQHPILEEPTGRFAFDLFSPWKMIKELIGPELARKLCCLVCCIVCTAIVLFWAVYFGGDLLASVIANSIRKD